MLLRSLETELSITARSWEGKARNPSAAEPQRDEAPAAALCGGSVVVLQESTQPRTTRNRPVAASRPLDGEEQSVAHALMVAFVMIVLDEFVKSVPE